MQDFPLRVMRLVDHAEREHGDGEIVSRLGRRLDHPHQLAQRRPRRPPHGAGARALGMKPGDRIATLAMNHSRHLTAWYGAIGMGGVLHTINPRLFDDQLAFIANHAEDRVLLYDRAFAPLVERMKPQWTTIEHYICFDPAEGEDGFPQWIAAEDGDYRLVRRRRARPAAACATPAAPPAIPRACSTSIARPCSTR